MSRTGLTRVLLRPRRGHTLLDVMVAMSLLGVVAGTALSGGEGHLKSIGRDYDDLRSAQAVTSRLELLDGARLVAGTQAFEPFPGAEGIEEAREREPGLWEVVVRVRARPDRPFASSATLVAVEPSR